ncbi:MAG: four helix bundle protein [Patescibacteria group bacterium]|nr:four helix bundle protein [Patescibacteria group bacterium]
MIYDLENRTKEFGREIIILLNSLRLSDLNRNIASQLIRSATSVGANYHEANGGSSDRDFRNKICICIKEARETKYWIEMLACAIVDEGIKCRLRLLWQEAHELVLIFAAIRNKIDRKK